MPTKKHRIMYVMEDDYEERFQKLKQILHRRSDSDMTMFLVADYIDRYERENGNLLNS